MCIIVSRSVENRSTGNVSTNPSRDRERYSTRNVRSLNLHHLQPRSRKPTSPRQVVNPIKSVVHKPSTETKPVDIDVASLMATLNSDDNVIRLVGIVK